MCLGNTNNATVRKIGWYMFVHDFPASTPKLRAKGLSPSTQVILWIQKRYSLKKPCRRRGFLIPETLDSENAETRMQKWPFGFLAGTEPSQQPNRRRDNMAGRWRFALTNKRLAFLFSRERC